MYLSSSLNDPFISFIIDSDEIEKTFNESQKLLNLVDYCDSHFEYEFPLLFKFFNIVKDKYESDLRASKYSDTYTPCDDCPYFNEFLERCDYRGKRYSCYKDS